MQYKVGDIVRVTDNVDETVELIGKIGKVVSTTNPEGCSTTGDAQWLTIWFDEKEKDGYPYDNNGYVIMGSEEVELVQ